MGGGVVLGFSAGARLLGGSGQQKWGDRSGGRRSACKPQGRTQRHLTPELITPVLCRMDHLCGSGTVILPPSLGTAAPITGFAHSPQRPLAVPLNLKAWVRPGGQDPVTFQRASR